MEPFRTGKAQLGGDAAGVDAKCFDNFLVFSFSVFNDAIYGSFGDAMRRVTLYSISTRILPFLI